MARRVEVVLWLLVLTLGSLEARSKKHKKEPKKKLNVLWLLIDDLRPQLNFAYGQTETATPNIDALARKSVVFERAYCQLSVCAPSRNSFMTGRRPDSLGVYNFIDHFRTTAPDAISLPEHFRNQGYVVLGAGKTYQPGKPPDYDEARSWSAEVKPYLPLNKSLTRCHYTVKGKIPDVCPEKAPHSDFMDSRIADYAISAMDTGNKNFFVAAGFYRPHLRWHVPREFYEQYKNAPLKTPTRTRLVPKGMPEIAWSNEGCHTMTAKTFGTREIRLTTPIDHRANEELRRGYFACVSWIDYNVGRVLGALKGKEAETIVLLSSDHGFHLGEQQSWTKHTLFEIGLRVPLLLHVPNVLPFRSRALVELTDIYRTLADLANVPPPQGEVQGRSLRPILESDVAVRNYSASQYPRCPRTPGVLWDANCKREASNEIPMMGYTIRVNAFRFTEWYHWMKHGRFGTIDTSKPPIATELYEFDESMGHDFDSFEEENLAKNRDFICAVTSLRKALLLFVQFCQHANDADDCHGRMSKLVDVKRHCPRFK